MNYLNTQKKLLNDTYFLVLIFILCTAGMMLFSTIIFYYIYITIYKLFTYSYYDTEPANMWLILVMFNLIIIICMTAAYWTRMALLRAGGAAIAEYCGANEITRQHQDYYSKRFQDVVEELAIACSIPIPRTYILSSITSINAFAAGYTLDDTAITITQGAMEKLNRNELQAVVAHEFSHIVHQDMRLNMQLLAFQSSINCFLDLAWIFDTNQYESLLDYIYIPLVPIIIIMAPFGVIGALFGSLLKLGVNRKREFLADASAVRYTRYSAGLLSALKKIGGTPPDRAFDSSSLQFVSHMMFDNGDVKASLVESHPAILARIQQYDPDFSSSQLADLRNLYQQQVPDGKEEDKQLGYCPDGVNYVRSPDHTDASIANIKTSEFLTQLQKIHNQNQPGDTSDRIIWFVLVMLIVFSIFSMTKLLYRAIHPAATLPPRMMVAVEPTISPTSDIPGFTLKNITFTPVATIDMQARVISIAEYKNDNLSAVSPLDYMVGWGNMSDSKYLSEMRFGLSHRSYSYSYQYSMRLNPDQISSHLAHVVIIPATDEIASFFKNKIAVDSIIEIVGYVVDLQLPGNQNKSSYFWSNSDPDKAASLYLWVNSVSIKQVN